MKKLSLIIALIALISCTGKKRAEIQLMECQELQYDNGKKSFTEYINEYEALLIKEEFLEDGSAESYYKLFERLINNSTSFSGPPSKFFLEDSFDEDTPLNFNATKLCFEELKKDSLQYDWTRVIESQEVVKKVEASENNLDTHFLYAQALSVYQVEDFELNYYKMTVFRMVMLFTAY